MLTYHIKDGEQQDAKEFLDLYLDALDEELVELHTLISACEEGARSAEGQTEVGKRDYTVRRVLFLSVLGLRLLTD